MSKLKISFRGHKAQKERTKDVLGDIAKISQMKECDARLKIQDLIDEHDLKASILVNGNTVWSKKRIMRNLKRIVKHGTLYDGRKRIRYIPLGSMLYMPATPADFKPILSRYFYDFLTSCCGSIAHYNIYGWIHYYPTVDYLKKFFETNEFGKPVRDWIPGWHTDAKRIVEEIEQKLFPFQTFLKSKTK